MANYDLKVKLFETLMKDFVRYFEIRDHHRDYINTNRVAVWTFLEYMTERHNARSAEDLLRVNGESLKVFALELEKGYNIQRKEISRHTVKNYMKVVRRFLNELSSKYGAKEIARPFQNKRIRKEYLSELPEGLAKPGLDYIEKRKNEGTPENSMKKIREAIDRFTRYLYEIRGLSDFRNVRKEDVKDFVKYLVEMEASSQTDKQGNKLEVKPLYCAASVNRYLHDLKVFLVWLSRRGYCPGLSNHVRLLRSEQRISRNILSRKEIVKFLNVRAENPLDFMLKTICVLLYASGLRVGELAALRLDRIDFENKSVCIFETKTRKERTVPIGDVGMGYLSLYLEKVRHLVCRGFTDESTAFISIYEGKTLCHDTINRFLREACKNAGIQKKITCHCFRHSFGTHLLENGAGIKTVSMLLGHTDLMSTEKYTRLNPESLRLTLLKYHPSETRSQESQIQESAS